MALKIEAVGFVGKDAEVKSLPDKMLTVFSLACTRRYKQPDGTYIDGDTTWLSVSIFGDYSSIKKGQRLVVTGNLESSKWVDKEGKEQSSLKVYAETVAEVIRRNVPNSEQGFAVNDSRKSDIWASSQPAGFGGDSTPF
jgi:single-strand DNA-binding protein